MRPGQLSSGKAGRQKRPGGSREQFVARRGRRAGWKRGWRGERWPALPAFPRAHSREGNGSPLQGSCLENARDGGAWWAAVYGAAQRRTQLKRLSSRAVAAACPLPSTSLGGSGLLPRLLWSPETQLRVLPLQIPTLPLTANVWTRVSLLLPYLPASPRALSQSESQILISFHPESPVVPTHLPPCAPSSQSPAHAGPNPPRLSMPPTSPYSHGRHTLPVCWNGFSEWCVGERGSFAGVLGLGRRKMSPWLHFFFFFF